MRRPSTARAKGDAANAEEVVDQPDDQAPSDAALPGDEDIHDPGQTVPPVPLVDVKRTRRQGRGKAAPPLAQLIEEALIPCLQRAAGLPSSSTPGSTSSRVTAAIVGQQGARSRAIVLRYGTRRDQSAILWVSPRGGLLCSCFEGTQNASFLSVSTRSTDCMHARVVNKCLGMGRVPVEKMRKRMGLRADAEDFAVPRVFDNTLVMYVLYQRVYSIVTFTAQSAICVAPGCRSFARRCGHVRVARQARAELKPEAAGRFADGAKVTASNKGRARFLSNEEEDDGLEKQPSDTIRADDDSPEDILCERARRNMLPCSDEVRQGDVWARSVDWWAMQERVGRGADPKDRELLAIIYTLSVRRGLIEDTANTLVEPRCGSCGTRREQRHAVVEEPALLFHHHPTAPAMHVCRCLTTLSLSFVVELRGHACLQLLFLGG